MSEKPYWDDGEIDPGIRAVVAALNKIPDVITLESCEGHGKPRNFHSFVIFLYKDGKSFPEWAIPILKSAKRATTCLGCIQFRLRGDFHFDCAHDLKRGWWLEIDPRTDYKGDIREDTDKVWAAVVKKIQEIVV